MLLAFTGNGSAMHFYLHLRTAQRGKKEGGESKPLRNCSAIEMAKSNKRQPDISVGEGMVDQEGGVSCI